MAKIVAIDNLARETIADRLVVPWLPDAESAKASEFCDWLNRFSCYEGGGMFHKVVQDNYALSKGMEDIV